MSRTTLIVSIALIALLSVPALACLWDSDTLQMERLRFPGVLEIITGKFVRHSQTYYEWRITDRKKKLESNPGDPALIDDLAVAYAKLGRPEDGIPLLKKVLKEHPDRYETLSNLGTLLFFAGRLDESKNRIRQALEINPDAHFGREKYQLLLTEYLQQSERDATGILCSDVRANLLGPFGFARFVLDVKLGPTEKTHSLHQWSTEELAEIRNATKGVLGMLHFADYQSPVLLEALGDLLMSGRQNDNNSQLAARTYFLAAQSTANQNASQKFRQMAREVLADHIDYENLTDEAALDRLALQSKSEVDNAQVFFAAIEADEKRWIAERRDLDAMFAAKYYDSLERTIAVAKRQVTREPREFRLSQRQQGTRNIVGAGLLCLGLAVALLVISVAGIWWYRSTRRRLDALNTPSFSKVPDQ